jgi:hypothetical protein
MPYAEIIDRHGRKRRARKGDVLGDGERFSFKMEMMDEDGIRDGHGMPAGHRRGYAFTADNHSRDEAAIAYEERNARLRSGYLQNRGSLSSRQPQQDGPHVPHVATHTLDEPQALANKAYLDKCARLDWRNRP